MNQDNYYGSCRNTETILIDNSNSKKGFKEVFNPKTEHFEVKEVKKKKYRTKIRATSVESFYKVLETIGDKQLECLEAIRKIQPCSDRQLKDFLHWEINQTTGRRNELLHMGIIIKYKEGISEKTKKKVIFWKIKEYLNDVMHKD